MRVRTAGKAPRKLYYSYDHNHGFWEIVLNVSGTGKTKIGNQEYEFGPGTVFVVPPNVGHSKTSENGFEDIFIGVDSINFDTKNKSVFAQDDEEKTIEMLIYTIIRVFHKKEGNHAAILDTLAQSVCNFILGRAKSEKEKNSDVELFINDLIINYTDSNFTVGEAMSRTNYNKDHFRRIFKEYTGTTPVEYLTKLRIGCAKNMLKSNNGRKIKEIAFESGFSDYLYFAKVFKKYTGKTPGEYAE